MTTKSTFDPPLSRASHFLLVVSFVFLLLLGLVVRLTDLNDLPLDFHSTRQMFSALNMRGMVYQTLSNVPEWQRDRAVNQWNLNGVIEPQISERLAVFISQKTGADWLVVGRMLSIIFWELGGLGLLLLARVFFRPWAALVGFGFFQALPYSIIASRALLPDLLMVALIVWSWWGLVRFLRSPRWGNAILAGLLGGLALFIKGLALFFILPVFAFGLLSVFGITHSWKQGKVWLLSILVVLPYAIYWIYSNFVLGSVSDQYFMRFFPQYWGNPVFYLKWYNQLDLVFSLPWLIIALLGTLFLTDKISRSVVLGGWVGCLLMGFGLSHHIATHDYYLLPLIPVAALGVSAVFERLIQSFGQPARLVNIAAILLFLGSATMSAYQARAALRRIDYRPEVVFWQDLGNKLGKDAKVVALSEDYGYRLEYWGWITPTNWLTSGDFDVRADAGQEYEIQKLIQSSVSGRDFFLVTLLDEFERQPLLKQYLDTHYPVFDQGDRYIIYDLRKPLQ